jgi:hypothetical protein
MATRQAQDVAMERVLSLVEKTVMVERRRVAAKEQCECLAHELTLLSLCGFELCMSITGVLPQAPLYEGKCFVVAQHTEVAMLLSTLLAAVSLATQSRLGCLPIDVSQAGAVGEMVARFQEQAEWCSCLETSACWSVTLFLGLQMAKSIWSLIWRRLPGDFR